MTPKQFILATIHRAENTDDPDRLRAIVAALKAVAADLPVVWPVHPRTWRVLEQLSESPQISNVRMIPPVGYLDMVALESKAALIATDSGGVQKEAFFHRVPCVTLRDETEWTELVELGWNRLSPPSNAERLVADIRAAVGSRGVDADPYGGGKASTRIADLVHARWGDA